MKLQIELLRSIFVMFKEIVKVIDINCITIYTSEKKHSTADYRLVWSLSQVTVNL